MPYGTIKFDTITFTAGGVDTNISVSGLIQNPTFTGNVTVTGTVSGFNVYANTVSGATVTGTTIQTTTGVFASGTAGAPSIQVGAGTTIKPGIYSPGTDQVALSTSGTGRLFVDASGKVGIGTSTPSQPLHINGSSGYTILQISDSATVACYFYASTTLGGGWIGTQSNHPFAFGTNNTERMRIDSAGRLGIGTSAPQSLLDVRGNAQIGAYDANPVGLELGQGATGNRTAYIDFTGDTTYTDYGLRIQRDNGGANTNSNFVHRGTGELRLWTIDAGSITCFTNNFERFRIDSAGRLGLGVTPTSSTIFYIGKPLTGSTTQFGIYQDGIIQSDVTSTNSYYVTSARTAAAAFTISAISHFSANQSTFGVGSTVTNQYGFYADLTLTGATNNYGFYSNIPSGTGRWNFYAGGTAQNYFAGNVGIGVTNPGAKLHLGDATAPDIRFSVSTTLTGNIYASSSDFNVYAVNSVPLIFGTGNTERARIDSSGRLLVGTSSTITDSFGGVRVFQTSGGNGYSIGAHRNDNTQFSQAFIFTKARGTAFETVVNNDRLGILSFQGANGSAFNEAAQVIGEIDGTVPGAGANNMPGRLLLTTTPSGSASPVERMRIGQAGDLFYGTGGAVVNPSSGTVDGLYYDNTNKQAILSRDGGGPLILRRRTSDGVIQGFYRDTIVIGTINVSTTDLTIANSTSGSIVFNRAVSSESARIDSSGRLLVGQSSAAQYNNFSNDLPLQISRGGLNTGIQLAGFRNDIYGADLVFAKSRSNTNGVNTIVQTNDGLSAINWYGADGTNYIHASRIETLVDGTPGLNTMPGRLVFSTTASGASSPTEQLRITNGGTVVYNQPAPAAVDTTATLTVANLTSKIITSSTAAAVTMTLPTGTLMDGGFSGLYTNMAFEWSVINTGGTNAVTIAAGTSHTIVGSATVAANSSGKFASRRTAATTWVTYRIS